MKKIALLLAGGTVLGLALTGIFLLIPWLPEEGSTQAGDTDAITYALTAVSFVIFALCMLALGYSVWKFRRQGEDDMRDGDPVHGHTGLEIFWTAIPTVIVVFFAVWGAVVLANNEDVPDEIRTVNAIGSQYAWKFEYVGEGFTSDELVLPIDVPVEIHVRSTDVLHSFYVAEWRVKQDGVPGRSDVQTYATPTKLGTFTVYCTELCGPGHAAMSTTNKARVVGQSEYDSWAGERKAQAEEQAQAAEDNPGLAVFTGDAGCSGCHALQAAGSTATIGPPLDDIAADAAAAGEQPETFVREAIINPDEHIADGYAPGIMPKSYGESLSPEEIDDLVSLLTQGDGS